MGYHAFSLDPRTVLGVSATATLEEIREAYRAKSKKHHPDLGGDEWAFRMVVRAYEVLKTTSKASASPPWPGGAADAPWVKPGWKWVHRTVPGEESSDSSFGVDNSGGPDGRDQATHPGSDGRTWEGESAAEARGAGINAAEFRTVDAELIWTRFESDAPGEGPSAPEDETDATLSVCLLVSWPPRELVDHIAEFESAGEIFRTLIDLFERLRAFGSVLATRSRVEDGRFVGWLSYPDVLAAQGALMALRETLAARGLGFRLQTRDERVPYDWHRAIREPVMSAVS
jgi:hypothetical protein